MKPFCDLSTTPFSKSLNQFSHQLIKAIPGDIVRCLGVEVTRLKDPIDVLLALDIENLNRAAQSVAFEPSHQFLESHLKHLASSQHIDEAIDHIWLEFDYQHPNQFSTFLGYPGNIQSDRDRQCLLRLLKPTLISPNACIKSRQIYRTIQARLNNSNLMHKINMGGHVISEAGWMERGSHSHIKILVTPGYQQQPSKLLKNLLSQLAHTAIKNELLLPLSKIDDIEQEPLNVHLSLALGPQTLRAAVEISHTPTQDSYQFDTNFCLNIQELPGLKNRSRDLFKELSKWPTFESINKTSATNLQLSHIKVPFSESSVQTERSKFYIRILPLATASHCHKSKP